ASAPPPAIPSAVAHKAYDGPIHAPIATTSLTSPPPIQRALKRGRSRSKPTPAPASPRAKAAGPPPATWATRPATKMATFIQLGILRQARSAVAAASIPSPKTIVAISMLASSDEPDLLHRRGSHGVRRVLELLLERALEDDEDADERDRDDGGDE